jgi:hypothetical protein
VVAVAQALVPLQVFTLKHLPATSAAEALIGAMANMAAAAAAIATPVVFLAVIIVNSSSLVKMGKTVYLRYEGLEEPILQKVHQKFDNKCVNK